MREIKFRAWDKNENCWINGFAIHQSGLFSDMCKNNKQYWYDDNQMKNIVIQQYTGLKDKNGKDIYEGDIVDVNHYGRTPKYETVRFYTIAGFAGIHPFTDSGYHWASHRCEIVGNIFQDGDLLRDS